MSESKYKKGDKFDCHGSELSIIDVKPNQTYLMNDEDGYAYLVSKYFIDNELKFKHKTIDFCESQPTPNSLSKVVSHFNDIVKEMLTTYEHKNKDYGNAYEKGYELFGYNQLLSRIYEKFCRVHNLLRGAENEVKSESISDTLTDMATQCICLRMLLENDNSSIDFKKQPR